MGKHRNSRTNEKKQAEEAQRTAHRSISEWVRGVLDRGTEFADQKHEEAVALARHNRMNDFMEMCGVGEPELIDYENPHVRINWLMCDPVNVRLVQNPKTRDRVYAQMDPAT